MSGWMNTCYIHLNQMIDDIEKKYGNVFWGHSKGDRRTRCDYPNCKNQTDYEVYWGDKPLSEINLGSYVPL